jgi:hypothetical protein
VADLIKASTNCLLPSAKLPSLICFLLQLSTASLFDSSQFYASAQPLPSIFSAPILDASTITKSSQSLTESD